MPILKLLIAFYLLPLIAPDNKPHQQMYFFNKSDRWCMNNITLSSDSVYFYSGSCEDDVTLAKGKWHMNGDHLILSNFDRKECLPNCTITAKAYTTPDSVRITFTDYFGMPFGGVALAVLFDSSGKETYVFTDSAGCIAVAKESCYAFHIKCLPGDTANPHAFHYVQQGMNDISVSIDYPNTAALEHEARAIDFEQLDFVIKDDMLYDDSGKVVYDNKYLSPVPEAKPIIKKQAPLPEVKDKR